MSWWMFPVWFVFYAAVMFASFFLGGFVYRLLEMVREWWTRDETKYVVVTHLDERGFKP
jgi:hypothetical protein